MKKLTAAVVLLAALLAAPGAARAGSTINPAVPATNAPLNSAPVRGNFEAAYNDVNNILGMFAGNTAPATPTAGQDWLDTTATPAVWYKWTLPGGWAAIGTVNLTTGVFAPTLPSTSFAATTPLAVTLPSGVITYALSYNSSLTEDGSNKLGLNLTNPNIFGAAQTVSLNAAALPAGDTGTLLQVGSADGTVSRIEATAAAASATFTGRRADGTVASPTTLVSGDLIAAFNAHGHDGTSWSPTVAGSYRIYAEGTWSSTSHPTEGCMSTTPAGSTTIADVFCVHNSGGATYGSPTGGDKGAGSINVSGALYINGVAVSAGSAITSGSQYQLAYYATTGTVNSGLTACANGVYVTAANNAPSCSTTLPSGIAATNMALTTPTVTGNVTMATGNNIGTSTAYAQFTTYSGVGFAGGTGNVQGAFQYDNGFANVGFVTAKSNFFGFTSDVTTPTNGNLDTALTRVSAGVAALGTGTAGSAAGTLLLTKVGLNTGSFINFTSNSILLEPSGNPLAGFYTSSVNFDLGSGILLGWESTTSISNSPDTGFARHAAGVVEVNNGTAGTLRDMTMRNLTLSGGIATSAILTNSGLAASPADGYALVNATAATAGATVQYSPWLRLTGQAWKSGAPAASQEADWVIYNAPSSASSVIQSELVFASQIAGGGYTTQAYLTNTGALTLNGGLVAPVIDVGSGTQGALNLENTSGYNVTVQSSNSTSAAWTLTLPVTAGSSNNVLTTNGSGVTSWTALSSIGVSTFSGGTTGLTPNTATAGAVSLGGTLVVANGGTNCSTATVTCFNNITGYSAAGATGTTSTNLVFSGAPTFTTSITDPLVIGGIGASSALTLESTSGAGTSDSIVFKTGSQATAGTITTAGVWDLGAGAAQLSVTGASTGGTVTIATVDSGSNNNLTINAKGSGTIGIGSVSTGAVTITPATTITGVLTLSATLSAAGLVTLADLATQAANTVVANGTSGSASPTAFAMPSCSTSASALQWLTNTGFQCGSITAAAASITYGVTTAGSSIGLPYNTSNGGTLSALTPVSGGVLYGASNTAPAFSALLTQYGVVYGGGSGGAPASTAAGTNGQLFIGQTSVAPAWETAGGDVSSISSGGSFTFASSNTHITSLANLTTVGALASGSLAAGFTAVTGPLGGTGLTTAAIGDIMYASATTPTWSRLADVAAGSVLVSGGVSTAPAWSATPALTSLSLGGASIGTNALAVAGTTAIAGNVADTNASGFLLADGAASGTVPTLVPNKASSGTGIGAQASGNMSLIVAGTEIARVLSTGINIESGSLTVNNNTILTAPSAATLQLGAASANPAVAQTLQVQGASGTNIAGQNFTIAGSLSTGTAADGNMIFQVGVKNGVSGSTPGVATTALTLTAETMLANFAGSILTTSTLAPSLSNGDAAVYASATLGGLYSGQGSTNDVTLANKSGTAALSVPTGTTNVTVAGTLAFGVLSPTSLGASPTTITGLAPNNSPITGSDYIAYYSSANGAINKITVAALVSAGVSGVSSVNGLSGGLTVTGGSGSGITVASLGSTVTLNCCTTQWVANIASTIASGASATLDDVDIAAATTTISGSTNITTATGFNKHSIYQPTYTATNSSPPTITNAATVYIANAPTTSSSGGYTPTITNAYALWVGGGATRLDGNLLMKGSSTGINTITPANAGATNYTNTIPAATGAFALAPMAAGGRLTLTSNTPVMTASATTAGTLYFDSYISNQVPYYNGTIDLMDTIASNQVSDAMAASSTGVLNAAGVFDVWWEGNTNHNICVTTNGSGGGWASDSGGSNTARGTGYSQLDNTHRPYVTNANSISYCYNGSTNYASTPIAAYKLTYLGSICTDASSAGKVSWTFGTSASGGGGARHCVWNQYNRVMVSTFVQDTSVHSYTSATIREAGGSTTDIIVALFGQSEDGSSIVATSQVATAAVANAAGYWGFGVDSTSTFSCRNFGQAATSNATDIGISCLGVSLPGVGLHTFSLNEGSDGSNSNLFGGGSAALVGISALMRM